MSIRSWQARPWRSKVLAAVCTLPLVVGASGCAGTPWGESLSSSFPTPQEQAPAQPGQSQDREPAAAQTPSLPPPASPGGSPPGGAVTGGAARSPEQAGPDSPAPAAPGPAPSRPMGTKAQASPAGKPPAPLPKPDRSPSLPSPYRVTIRLPQADPAAPAEGVTQALRAAGIPFEVETIERVKGQAAPPSTEAAPGAQAPPSVRPAPPPR